MGGQDVMVIVGIITEELYSSDRGGEIYGGDRGGDRYGGDRQRGGESRGERRNFCIKNIKQEKEMNEEKAPTMMILIKNSH